MNAAELQVAVLQELGVLSTGESANPADAAIVDQKYATLYEMLLSEGLVSWAADDDVPDFAGNAVVLMTAYLCCGAFEVPPQKKAELTRRGQLNLKPSEGGPSEAEIQLRRQLASRFVYQPAQTEYF